MEPEHEVALAALALPASPVELLSSGSIRLAGDEARAPHLVLRNVGSKPVRSVEVSWLVQDTQGREYAAGTLPADVSLAPGETRPAARDGALRFSLPGGAPASVLGLTGFVSSVEFADGGLWLPTRQALENPRLRAVLPLSGEQERLVKLSRRRPSSAVIAAAAEAALARLVFSARPTSVVRFDLFRQGALFARRRNRLLL